MLNLNMTIRKKHTVKSFIIFTILLLLFLKFQLPGGELHELLIGTVVVALALVQFCDSSHFLGGESKVHDVKIVLDVPNILASGNHDEAHLCVPAENNLGGRFPVFFPQLRKNRFFNQAFIAVAQGILAHKADAVLVQRDP